MAISNNQRGHNYYKIPSRVPKQGNGFSVSQGFKEVEVKSGDLSDNNQAKENTRCRPICIPSFTTGSSLNQLGIGSILQGNGYFSKFMD